MSSPETENDSEDGAARSPWAEVVALTGLFRERVWAGPFMVALGLGAALADTLGVGLAVMLLFALLGQTQRIAEGGGILARIHQAIESVVGSDVSTVAAVFFVFILLSAMLVYAYQVMTAVMMNHVAQRMRDLVHHQYVTLSYRYLQPREQGLLLHILATETWTVSDAFYHLARVGVNVCAVLVFGAGLFFLSWIVGITAFACAIAVFALLRMLSVPVRRLGRETLAANQVLAERMLVSLHGMRTLRVFAQETYLLRVFGAASSRVRRLAIRAEWIKALIGPLGEVGSLGALIVIALVAGRSGVDVPTTIAAVLLLFRLQPHLREIETSRLALAGMNASLRSVRETLIGEKPLAVEGSKTFAGMAEALRFEGVTFSHDPRRRPSLDAVSFTIRKGETTLLAGPSGSGKTTILNLILRLYDPDGGRITVDGIDFHEYTRASWLSSVAIAGQDIELIEGTLAQNLKIGARDADMAALRHVCDLVEILDDIEALPDGFDTRIGPAGQNFSGGQRQRIGLARALLRAPDFLILDEAMSAIEPDREMRIRERIAEVMRNGTILVVSHRADAAVFADRTIAIAQGRIVDSAGA
ncbi:MAG: ABC transporter ATP-binding protein [Roseivivax sp.]|nr:ABC transporter ATP-binding protein [Roseivivax sp.]